MVSLNGSQIDMSKLELGDIIDVNTLQSFLDNFAIGFNCAAVSVGRRGEEFTKPSHYRPFCSDFIHASSIGDARCAVCHNDFGRKAISQGRPYIGQCHAGLVDFSAPVIIRGEHIGTVLGGQILDKPAVEQSIRRVASEINVSEDGLWDASRQIDIVPMRTIEAAAQVLYIVVNALAEGGFNRIETDLLSSSLANNFIEISANVEALTADSQSIADNQRDLVSEINQIQENINEVTKVLNSIKRITDETKILGINAAIEAARIGSAGKSFAVVAEQIRKLSETTRQTVDSVERINEMVEHSITTTMQSADRTLATTRSQSSAMDKLSVNVQDSVSLAEKLRVLFNHQI
jgi:ligand-binding sensor protein